MVVDWSVELGAEDPVLDFPWTAEDRIQFYDLKADPGLIDQLPEAQTSSELKKFLLRMNADGFPLQTAKCDHWFTQQISEEEEIFGAAFKYGSYVDLLFVESEKQLSFADHEEFASKLCDLLKGAPEIPASVELIVRRCFYAESGEGFYFTLYVSGFGETEAQSRQQWSIALTLVQHGLVASFLSKPQKSIDRG
jgi:hypothetical protein